MKKNRTRALPYTLILILILAVLVPSIALSVLALRAAERESVYVERKLEEALMAEVDLASGRVEQLTSDIYNSLAGDFAVYSLPDPPPLSGLPAVNPLIDTPFELAGGRLVTADIPGRSGESLISAYGDFLEGNARLPAYDLITRVYRREAGATNDTASSKYSSVTEYAASEAPMFTEREVYDSGITEPEISDGISRQIAESQIANDTETRERMFEQVSQEGFEVHPRNVISKSSAAPDLKQKPAGMAPAPEADRSRTVSRSRSFAELSSESDGGLLPYMSDHGLELLFWTKLPGKIVGCTLRMDMLRARAADVIPGILSDVRILTVLDESGTPIVAPEIYSPTPEPDWRRPFAAREISPILPRWEVGAWLTNPSALADRARLAQVAAWVQVAILFSVMLAGSMIVIRMTSYEMRVASQKTTFVANVSHELKTPLTSIRLFAELLLSGRQENEERRREYLRTMMSEADRLSHLVDNVLSFSRRGAEKYNFQTISLAEVARDTISQLEPHLTKLGYTISFSEDSPLFIKGNREAMKQVIMNLLSNAEKYSGESREISIESREQGDFAVVKIADRGIGVDPLLTEKIFQEFVRGDDSLSSPRSGTGLGLSIARDIARRHGGDVLYEPRTGGGSVFSLILSLLKSE